MPTYLCHGFRWYRRKIREFVILNDLDDCAPDWVIAPSTAAVILSQLAESFDFVPRLENEDGIVTRQYPYATTPTQEKHPEMYDEDFSVPPSRVPVSEDSVLMYEWSPIKLLEEYDANETSHAARPYAYVADHAVRVDLGVNIATEMARYNKAAFTAQRSWFENLRSQLQPEEAMAWYVVVCEDAEREAPEDEMVEDEGKNGELNEAELAYIQAAQNQRPTSKAGASSRTSGQISSDDARSPPSGPLSETRGKQTSRQPDFLSRDPFESPPSHTPRLKKKISIRRLFSKKEG